MSAGEAKQAEDRAHVGRRSGLLALGHQHLFTRVRSPWPLTRGQALEGIGQIAGGARPAHGVIPAVKARVRAKGLESSQAAAVACQQPLHLG